MTTVSDALKALYGRGFQYPVVVDPTTGGIQQANALDSIRASLHRLFDTMPGEDRFNPAYGCGLRSLVFENDTVTLRALVDTVVRDAIQKWEPRIASVLSVLVTSDPSVANTITVSISAQLIQSGIQANFVIPFVTQPPA